MTRQRVGLGVALVLAGAVVLAWPMVRAWWTFPVPDGAGVLDALARGARTHATFAALDAQGRTLTLTADRIAGASPGPCRARYGRSSSEEARGALRLHGTAVIRCRVDLTVADHGPLRAGVEVLGDTALPVGRNTGARMLSAEELAREAAP